MQTQDVRCNSCGFPLEITSSSQNIIKCSQCGVVNVIKELGVTCTDNNQTVVGGLPVTAGGSAIHRSIVLWIIEHNNVLPIDLFYHLTITDVKRFCVSCYLYECDASVGYCYEVGNNRERIKEVNGTQYTETYTEYTHQNDVHYFSGNVICSGNSGYVEEIQAIYNDLNTSNIVDLNAIKYPDDVTIQSYDISTNQTDSKVKEIVGQLATQQIQKELQRVNYRNLHVRDSFRVDFGNSPKRLYLPLIHVTFSYKDMPGEIWLSGNAQKIWVKNYPQDTVHMKKCQGIQKKIGCSFVGCGTIVFGIAAIFAGIVTPESRFAIFIGVFLAGLGTYFIIRKEVSSQQAQKQLDELNKQHLSYFLKFLDAQTPLKGVLQKGLSGKPEAFPKKEELKLG